MALPLHKQTLEAIKRSHRPVVILPAGCGADGYACAFAIATVLETMDKTVDIVSVDGPAPKNLDFLGFPGKVRSVFGQLRKFVIAVDVNKAPLQELSYDVENGQLSIYLTPRHGSWSQGDVDMHTSAYRYDLVITVGAHDFESFGTLFENNNDFFYATPIINVDHASENEHFGQMNVVDLTATSNAEVLLRLIEKWAHNLITENVATMLLTGMIAKTRSFKVPSVTPMTLQLAGQLVERGARREAIIDNLYRTRSVETLRLWGRALARLKKDTQHKLVWSMLSRQDFMNAGADEDDLSDVIDELIRNSPEARVIVLLYEDREGHVCGLISGGSHHDSLELAVKMKPSGTRDLSRVCFKDKTIAEAEKFVIGSIKDKLGATKW